MPRKLFTAALVFSLAAAAEPQASTTITLPPNTRQTGQFPVANTCPSSQIFKLSAQPPADWLRLQPDTVNVGPYSSSPVQLTVSPANRALGSYRSAVKVVCLSCAAGDPPCQLDAREFPIEMTVANVRIPGDFQTIPEPVPAVSAITPPQAALPKPYIPPEQPKPSGNRVFLPVAGGLLAIGLIGMILAVRALTVGRKVGIGSGDLSSESQRHQVRR